MEEQTSVDGETEILVKEDVRSTGQDPDIGETERGLEEDVGKGGLKGFEGLLLLHIALASYHIYTTRFPSSTNHEILN